MKSENISKLLKCLKGSEAWISANELGKMINVNKRTIINYVNEINRDVISSKEVQKDINYKKKKVFMNLLFPIHPAHTLVPE